MSKLQTVSLIAGSLLGAGLAYSGLTNPNRIISFLDITSGNWDYTLIFVLGVAVPIFAVTYYFTMKSRTKPVYDSKFFLPSKTQLEPRIFIGAAIFGIGWGLSGICHGPAIAAVALGEIEVFIYLGLLIASGYLFDLLVKLKIVK